MDELLLLASVLLALIVFPSVQDSPATNNGALLYNSSDTICPKSVCSFESVEYNESCLLGNNSAALGPATLGTQRGMVCHSPSPAHTVAWLHPNGSMVMVGNTHRVFVDPVCTNELRRNGVFVGSTFDGLYTCIASEDDSNTTEVLFVIGIYEIYPPLTVDNLTVNALIGSTDAILILNCSSRGLPATTVRWLFDNQLIDITVGERTQNIADRMNTVYHSLLTIQKQDIVAGRLGRNGQYTCEVDAGIAIRYTSTSFDIIPNTPMQLEITSSIISWLTVTGPLPTQYQVEFQGGHCSTRDMVSANDTSLALDNLQGIQLNGGASYTVQVRAVNPFVNGEWSNIAQLHTETSKPSGAPEGVVGLPMTTSVLVMWDEVNCSKRNGNVTHYHVSSQGSGSTLLMNTTVSASLRQANLTGLEPGRQYRVSVSAVNEAGEGLAYTINITTNAVVDNASQSTIYIACGVALGLLLLFSSLLACCSLAMCKLHRRKTMHATNSKQLDDIMDTELPEEILAEIEIAKGAATNEPIIHDFPSDLEVCEGEYVLLYVTVTGNPPPTLTWYHDSEGINTDTSIEVGANGTLSIPSMEEKHVGMYRLVASNCYGSCFEEMQLGLEDEDTFVLRRAESIASMIDNSPVPVSSFEEYVSLHHCKNNEAFHFQFVCLNTYSDMPSTIGSAAENRILNRFKNIIPYDENRITLNPVSGSHDYQNDYVNASYIDGNIPCKFIATQGPLPHTVVDFWRLVWQESTSVIVMLCDIVEAHRVKCQQYWPETGSHTYGPVTVQKLHEVALPVGYVVRKFEVSAASGPSLKVTHYQFKSWPEHSVPSCAGELLALIERIKAPDSVIEGAILVHCSTGVGRTGVFIALDTALCQAREDERVDIIGIINSMRCQRMKMVQTLAQFVFIHDAVLECLVCGNTQIPVTDFRLAWNRMSRVDKDTGRTDLENQYRVLKKITPKVSEVDTKVAQQHPQLNRFKDYLPRDQRRVILNGTEPGHDYINASFVDGYKQKKAFIITQGPLESTCSDFWRMIHQYQCGTVVMLSDLSEYKQEVCFQYWPKEGEMRYGYYRVQLLGESQMTKDVTMREFCLASREGRGVQEVTQFQVQHWTPDGLSADYSSIADLIQNILTVQRRTGNKPIVVHCSDTVSRSAIFCAAVNAIERFKADNIVDIYQIVKSLRLQKTQAIMSVEQYSAIFSIVIAYSDGIDDKYDNFKQHRAQVGGAKVKQEASPLSEEEDEF